MRKLHNNINNRLSKRYSEDLLFRVIENTTLVYTNEILHEDLTLLFESIDRQQGDTIARSCVSLLYAVDQMGSPGHVWTASVNAVQTSIEAFLAQRYAIEPRPNLVLTRLVCSPLTNPSTVKTVLSRLQLAFATGIALELRTEQPMDCFTLPNVKKKSAQWAHSALDKSSMRRTSRAIYRVIGDKIEPELVLDNDALPDDLRAAAQRAHWSLRDHAVLEILIASGARVTEVVEATWAGIGRAGLETGLLLHNKRYGRVPSKKAALTSQGLTALTSYLATERTNHDPLQREFATWNRGRQWTIGRYLAFLHARGIEPSEVPLFLTQRGEPYTAATFRRQAWRQARMADGGQAGRIVVSPHHIRHWYVNRELKQIAAEYSDSELRYVTALLEFTQRMGWASWASMRTYDHRGVAIAMLQRHDQQFQRMAVAAHHGDGAQMHSAAQQAGLAPASERIR